jgi:hypothetical protein
MHDHLAFSAIRRPETFNEASGDDAWKEGPGIIANELTG